VTSSARGAPGELRKRRSGVVVTNENDRGPASTPHVPPMGSSFSIRSQSVGPTTPNAYLQISTTSMVYVNE